LVAGRKRVPRPAAGKTAFRTRIVITDFLLLPHHGSMAVEIASRNACKP
jgi:hypothetical protein